MCKVHFLHLCERRDDWTQKNMVDEVVSSVAPNTAPAIAETVVAAPPSATPVVSATPEAATTTPAPIPTADAAAVVVAPTTIEQSSVVAEAPKSLLNEANKPAVEAPKVEAPVEPVVTQQSDETAPLPTYEPWVLPDTVKQEDEKVQQFTSQLANFEKLTKADHAEVQKFGQELLNYHVAEQTKAVEGLVKQIQDVWEKQKNDWRSQVETDPAIGGERLEATLTSANQLLNTHAPKTGAEFRSLMEESGYGNHPTVLRFLSEVSGNMSEGTPLAAVKPPAASISKIRKFYGGK